MDATLVRIKRLLLAGRYAFSFKAETEMFADDIRSEDVIEAVVNAPPSRRPYALEARGASPPARSST